MAIPETKEKNSRPEEKESEWVSLDSLKKALEGLATPLQTKVMDWVKKSVRTGFVSEARSGVADLFLREITERVFGFSLNDLGPQELREVERIKKEFGLGD